MKKNVIFLILLTSSFAFGQVGFNTPNPQATVDIVAKNATGKSTNVDGLLVPRVDRERAQVMVGVPVSTLVYINSIATGSQTGIAANIDAVGYYYHNGTAWIKLESTNQNLNIYTSDGTLSDNRAVKLEDKTLAFAANSKNAFSVDGATFSVDAGNNKVGIGTIDPTSELQVVGNEFRLGGPSSQAGTVANPLLRIHSNANEDGLGGEIRFNEDNTGYGYYLRHNTGPGATYGLDGLAIGSVSPGSYDYNPAKPGMFVSSYQDVGFGTSTPQTVFHVDAARDNNINIAPTAIQQSNDVVITSAGTVGLGNLSPRGALDINKGETNDHGLVLPTNANVNNFTNPLGGSVIAGTLIYDSTNDCVRFYKKNGSWGQCINGGTTSPETGTVTSLDCANATNSGTLTSGISASGVSSTISYTQGNGGSYSGQTVLSENVTGLIATLTAGSFNNGTGGTLTYTITGTPSSSGTANFHINIGGKICTLTRNVIIGPGSIKSLDCSIAKITGVFYPGEAVLANSKVVISYTGGNGGNYTGQTIQSSEVLGLTATLSSGSFANGDGTLTYNITGTPSTEGVAYFNISIGGATCTFSVDVTSQFVNYKCTSIGYHGVPTDYTKYYANCQLLDFSQPSGDLTHSLARQYCSLRPGACSKDPMTGKTFVPYLFKCTQGAIYDPNIKQCRWP